VTVTNPDTQSASLTNAFTVNAPAVLTLTGLSPTSAIQGQTLNVVLTGTNFASGAACSFGTGITVTTCTFNSSSQLTANITVSSTATAGSRTVTVTNPDTQSASLTNAFTVNVVQSSNGLAAAYALNDGAGTSASDKTGNGNTGTLINGPAWVAAKYGTGVKFDGIDDAITVPNGNFLALGSTGTIEAWVTVSQLNRWHSIVAKGNANNDALHNYALEINNANRFICILGNGSAARTLLSTTSVVTGQYYHVACVWNGTNLQLYVNGTLNASVAQSMTPAANTAPLYLGQFGGNVDRISGVIDEVRIYNRSLTQTEIQSDMNSPL
jgi:hypothetical protein